MVILLGNNARKIALSNEARLHFAIKDDDDISNPSWLYKCVDITREAEAIGVAMINFRVDEGNKKELSNSAVNQTPEDDGTIHNFIARYAFH